MSVSRTITVWGVPHEVQVLSEDASGTPLLLRNGVGTSDRLLEFLAEYLTGRPIIIVEPKHLGLPLPHKALLMAMAVHRAGFEEIDVLGVSYGGTEAQQLALTSELRRWLKLAGLSVPKVRRSVLVSTSPNAVPGKPAALAGLTASSVVPSLHRRLAHIIHGDVDNLGEILELLSADRSSLRKIGSNVLSLAGWCSLPFLPFITSPVQVIHGGNDRLVPVVNARLMAKLLPDAELRVWDNEGHLLVLSQVAGVCATAISHLDKHLAGEEAQDPQSDRLAA